jgi:N-acetyl-anhydromuramyl-L-alanine amidase AmpD
VKLPTLPELPAAPAGIVVHWTGGTYRANSVDLGAYHLLVEEDERIRSGTWPIAANMVIRGENYAKHCGGWNTRRIGVAYCAERDAQHPITERQWRAGIRLLAELCDEYRIDPAQPRQLCTHMEVWTLHQIRGSTNHTKRDIDRLRFRPELKAADVGPFLRSSVAELLAEYRRTPRPARVVIR